MYIYVTHNVSNIIFFSSCEDVWYHELYLRLKSLLPFHVYSQISIPEHYVSGFERVKLDITLPLVMSLHELSQVMIIYAFQWYHVGVILIIVWPCLSRLQFDWLIEMAKITYSSELIWETIPQ